MASSKGYMEFVIGALAPLGDVTYRRMMGEYIIYYQGKVVGGVYDDRFLLKGTKSALALLNEANVEPVWEIPYPGAKRMLAADAEEEIALRLIEAIAGDLAAK